MGLTLEQAFAKAREAKTVQPHARILANVTISTNQDNGIVSYAAGALLYEGVPASGTVPFVERLHTPEGTSIPYLFSDRTFKLPEDLTLNQPFSIRTTDKLGLSLTVEAGKPRAHHFDYLK